MEQYFIPADSSYHVCTQVLQSKHIGNMYGYIATFTCLALKVSDLSDAEKLDKYLCGLKPAVFELVIL